MKGEWEMVTWLELENLHCNAKISHNTYRNNMILEDFFVSNSFSLENIEFENSFLSELQSLNTITIRTVTQNSTEFHIALCDKLKHTNVS